MVHIYKANIINNLLHYINKYGYLYTAINQVDIHLIKYLYHLQSNQYSTTEYKFLEFILSRFDIITLGIKL
jgi:hypothetical protein